MPSTEFHSNLIPDNRLLTGLLGLRGIAALSIVLFHTDRLTGISAPEPFGFVGKEFAYSVHLFFVLSAFSLMYSTSPSLARGTWMQEYFIKRFFRIAPLFYVMIGHEILRQYLTAGAVITPTPTILMNFAFVFNFWPFTGIVWGGWAIGVEMLFYAIFPVLLFTLRTPRALLVCLGLAFLASTSVRMVLHAAHQANPSHHQWDWSYFAFLPNLWLFILGMVAFRFADTPLGRRAATASTVGPLIALGFLVMIYWAGDLLKGPARLDLAVYGFLFAALCVWQYLRPTAAFANRFLEYCGERSFSLYLLHPVAIFYLKPTLMDLDKSMQPLLGPWSFVIVAGCVLLVLFPAAEISYRLVEAPGIGIGRKLVRRARRKAS